MRLISRILIPVALLALTACTGGSGDGGDGAPAELAARCDSLQQQNEQLGQFISTIAECIDSISIDDVSIMLSSKESPADKRRQLLDRIALLSSTLEAQRQKIARLSGQIDTLNPRSNSLRTLIANLNTQIETREATIASLKKQLESKNADITRLKSEVSGLKTEITELNELTGQQEEALTEQDKMINTAYVKIATQKELKDCGLLTGGSIFKKKKLDTSAMNVRLFKEIDIRQTTSFDIPGKKPKILTAMPEDSYVLTDYGDHSSLRITNPTRFWSVSNFLIVQYK